MMPSLFHSCAHNQLPCLITRSSLFSLFSLWASIWHPPFAAAGPVQSAAYQHANLASNNSGGGPQSLSPSIVMLCADGKGPLLDGEEKVFGCARNNVCPPGFDCEMQQNSGGGGEAEGICCPNLGELYRLYKETSGEEEETGDQPSAGKDPQQPDIDAMALLEQHYGGSEVTRSSSALSTSNRPSPKTSRSVGSLASPAVNMAAQMDEEDQLVHSRPVEIRRSQPNYRWQAQQKTEESQWRPRARAQASKPVHHQPAAGHARATAIGAGRLDGSGEEYSCKRQRLELFCEDAVRRTQFVLRWFAKEGQCVSYPWGYCPGEPVASDRTLRTRDECELLCTDPLDSDQDAPVLNMVRFGVGREIDGPKGGGGGNNNIGEEQKKGPLEGGEKAQRQEQQEPFVAQQGTGSQRVGEEQPPPEAPGQQEQQQRQNQEFAPAPHQGQQPSVQPASPSPQSPPLDIGLRQQEEEGQRPNQQQQTLAAGPSSSSAELADFLLSEQRPPPNKRCTKVTPYRAMCPDGMPSQFTLRWFHRAAGGDACFAYPYGYCQGDSVFAEDPIKTERECVAYCVAGTQPAFDRARAMKRRH